MKTGLLYFYVHFVTEVICFFTLYRYVGTRPEIWILYLSYDMLAFVPQGIIGSVSDRFPRVPMGSIGLFVMAFSSLLLNMYQIHLFLWSFCALVTALST